jgi:hypothetical protein
MKNPVRKGSGNDFTDAGNANRNAQEGQMTFITCPDHIFALSYAQHGPINPHTKTE